MNEKTSAELFAEETELQKESNSAYDKVDDIEREIVHLRNQIDTLRTQIRNLDNEARDWKSVIRAKKLSSNEAHRLAWAAKHSGL